MPFFNRCGRLRLRFHRPSRISLDPARCLLVLDALQCPACRLLRHFSAAAGKRDWACRFHRTLDRGLHLLAHRRCGRDGGLFE